MPNDPDPIEEVMAELLHEGWITQEDLCGRWGIGPELLEVCIHWDIIHPPQTTPQGMTVFPHQAMHRLCCGLRLHRDLEINWAGISIVLDLTERIEELESLLPTSRPPLE